MNIQIHQSDAHGNIIQLLDPVEVEWRGKVFTIPAGFQSDGVSTPRFLWGTISPAVDPRTLRAGVAHDFLYRTQPQDWTRQMADELFYDFCRADGLNWWASQKAYWGLRLFGGAAWRDNRKLLEKKL